MVSLRGGRSGSSRCNNIYGSKSCCSSISGSSGSSNNISSSSGSSSNHRVVAVLDSSCSSNSSSW